MRATILPYAIILTRAHRAAVNTASSVSDFYYSTLPHFSVFFLFALFSDKTP